MIFTFYNIQLISICCLKFDINPKIMSCLSTSVCCERDVCDIDDDDNDDDDNDDNEDDNNDTDDDNNDDNDNNNDDGNNDIDNDNDNDNDIDNIDIDVVITMRNQSIKSNKSYILPFI